jgi:hypothetical protein
MKFQTPYIIIGILIVSMALAGCGQGYVNSVDGLKAYVWNPANGLVKTHAYNEVEWKVKLVPREVEESEQLIAESEKSVQRTGTVHFMVNVAAGRAYEAGDVMMAGVGNYEEYADRMIQLNFRLEEGVRLKVGGKELAPVLFHMENTFGLTQDRNIHILFADPILEPDLRSLPQLDLVIEDWVFGTGISHYVFQEAKLEKIPLLRS